MYRRFTHLNLFLIVQLEWKYGVFYIYKKTLHTPHCLWKYDWNDMNRAFVVYHLHVSPRLNMQISMLN